MATDENGNDITSTGVQLLPRQRSGDPAQPYPDSHFVNEGGSQPASIYPLVATHTETAQAEGLVEHQVEEFVKPIQAVHPAYVHIVHHITHTMEEGAADYETETFILAAKTPVRVLPRDSQRRRATILNSGANPCVVGKLQRVANNAGFPLVAGAAEDWHSVPDVWAYSTLGTTIDIKVERNRYSDKEFQAKMVSSIKNAKAGSVVGDSASLNDAVNS